MALQGLGTSGSPYLIYTLADLDQIRNNLTAYYKIMDNIDATQSLNMWNGLGWAPIGTYASKFSGYIDGNYKTILGLSSFRETSDYVGFIAAISATAVSQTKIKNLKFKNCNIKGRDFVGILCGFEEGITVENVEIENSVIEGRINIGSLIGYTRDNYYSYTAIKSIISGCRSTKTKIKGSNYNTGVAVSAVGGLIGYIFTPSGDVEIKKSYLNDCEIIINALATYTESSIGGFVGVSDGTNSKNVILRDCYAQASISIPAGTGGGGLVGKVQAPRLELINTTWDIDVSERTNITASGAPTYNTNSAGMTTEQIKNSSIFTGTDWAKNSEGMPVSSKDVNWTPLQETIQSATIVNTKYKANNYPTSVKNGRPYIDITDFLILENYEIKPDAAFENYVITKKMTTAAPPQITPYPPVIQPPNAQTVATVFKNNSNQILSVSILKDSFEPVQSASVDEKNVIPGGLENETILVFKNRKRLRYRMTLTCDSANYKSLISIYSSGSTLKFNHQDLIDRGHSNGANMMISDLSIQKINRLADYYELNIELLFISAI